jgi:hypothetical protein
MDARLLAATVEEFNTNTSNHRHVNVRRASKSYDPVFFRSYNAACEN